jgi:hypothetical protein
MGCDRAVKASGLCHNHYMQQWRRAHPKPPRERPRSAPIVRLAVPVEDAAWAAGFFEGEGSVRIGKATTRTLGSLCCSVVNTDKECIDFFQRRWPAHVRPATGLRPGQRPAWIWVATARHAAAFLAEIQPHLRTERVRRKVRLGLDYQAQKTLGGHQGPEYRAAQQRYYLEMKTLNRRGVVA